VSDDWRVTVTLPDAEAAESMQRALADAEAERGLGDRVAVSRDEAHVFLYADTSAHAHEAERVVRELAAADGLAPDVVVHRWHPIEERWEDEDAPLPATEAERHEEHERLEADESAESERLGLSLWEVRVELGSHHDAVELARRLESERDELLPGWRISVVRRWKYLIVGAESEDQATELGQALEAIVPPGATIHVEAGGGVAWRAMDHNPFAVFGGLGG